LAQQTDASSLPWQAGPLRGRLGEIATVTIPAGLQFVGQSDAGRFMEMTQNPSDGRELGVVLNLSDPPWFAVFSFAQRGYVKDDERDALDADKLLTSIKRGTEVANQTRRERGWSTLNIVGWQRPPFYDPRTSNLTWAINGTGADGDVVNHSTRLLGRRGVMEVDLVLAPQHYAGATPTFNALLSQFSFNPGERYSEFRRGDKVAEYGLTGLIVGGTGAALVKTGLLQKLWKFLVIGFLAVVSFIKKLVGGRRSTSDQTSNV
jgi:uncharacterized membrane-anchored protein